MNSYRIAIRTADCNNCILSSPTCFLFDSVDQFFGTFQSDPALNAHTFQNFLDHSLACAGILLCHISCLFSTGYRKITGVIHFDFSVILCCIGISGKNIKIICQSVHVFLGAVICAKLHTYCCHHPFCPSGNSSCYIDFS